MYAIISGGTLAALTDKPRWIKVKADTGVFVAADREDAVGVAAGGAAYNLPGRTDIPDAPEARIVEVNGGEILFSTDVRLTAKTGANSAAIVAAEDALCEQDGANDARMELIEDALCELDAKVNG